MNITQLLNDYNIQFFTEGYKFCRPGWINLDCPFCTGNPGPHLGYNLNSDYFNCWRCGGKSIEYTLQSLLKVNKQIVKEIIKQYQGVNYSQAPDPKIIIRKKAFKLPSNTDSLKISHKKYLEKRGFDSEKLEKQWNLLATGPISKLDNVDFKHRLIIPIFWYDKQVSFQSRDITDKSKLKYITCSKERELIFHKNILFGDQIHWKETGICVEGLFDVFRFGVNSFATFGIKYTPAQLKLMAKSFKRIPVCFDDDSQATEQANKLVADLRFRGVESWRIDIKGDPGAMSQEEADYLVKQLIK